MRSARGVVALGLLIAASVPAAADVVADCSGGREASIRLKACTEVIANPNFGPEQKAAAFRSRGYVRTDAGATDQAIADFSEAIRLAPGDAAAFGARAQARLTRNEVDAAIGDYTAALQASSGKPVTVSLLVGRGHAYLVKGQLELSLADFDEAVRINPKSASALNNRGLAWRTKGDLAKTVDDYTAAINLNPVYALAYNNRGYAYEAMDRRVDAIADFDRALLLDRSLVGAAAGLKRLKAAGPHAAEVDVLIAQGRALVEANCSRCHAVGDAGPSTNPKAPEFRSLSLKHPVLALREPLSRGLAAQHDEMPKFALTDADVDKVVAYINSLAAPKGN